MTATAAQVIARSESPVTTRTGGYVPSGHFSAVVILGGQEFEYLFAGDAHDMSPDAPALGRIRRVSPSGPEFRVTAPDGYVVASVEFRHQALHCLVAYTAALCDHGKLTDCAGCAAEPATPGVFSLDG